jgi:methionyl aminopeptidase
MPISLKNRRAIKKMRAAGRIVAETFAILEDHIGPGVTLRELDQLADDYLRSQGATPLYKGYRGNPPSHPPFPGVICASVNQEICHGLPDRRVLQDGDVVGIDIGLRYDGYCGDACVTYGVGTIAPQAQQLLTITR